MEALIAFGVLALIFIGLLVLGACDPRSAQEVTGGADQRRWAAQAEIEGRDVDQMLTAQNDSRLRRGKTELTEAEIAERARSAQRQSLIRARRAK